MTILAEKLTQNQESTILGLEMIDMVITLEDYFQKLSPVRGSVVRL